MDYIDFTLNDEEEWINDGTNGDFMLKMHLCWAFFGFIIGKRGQTKMKIETETQTTLIFPKENINKKNENANFIQIKGRQKVNVINAYRRIKQLEQTSRMKQNFSHFLSIPLSFDANFKTKFNEFKAIILSDPKCSTAKCIDESVFQSEDRVHLTIKILYIGDSYERKFATKHLESFQEKILQKILLDNMNEPIMLHIKGLDIMNDDPSEANVLYAKVTEIGNRNLFKEIVNKLYDWFTETNLVCETDRYVHNDEWKVKIHATIMNTRYRMKDQEDSGKHRYVSSKVNKMDVSNILDKYFDYDFGYIQFNQIHISTRSCLDKDNNYYLPLAKIIF